MNRYILKTMLAAVLTAATAICGICQTKSDGKTIKWHNPEEAGFHVLQGQKFEGQERECFYHRLPSRYKEIVRPAVWRQSKQAAGESIVFTTDAERITVRYIAPLRKAMPHMPSTGVSGVDLYTSDRNGNEVWVAGKYSFKDTVTFTFGPIDIVDKPEGPQRYTLFLPLYNEVKWMEIGTDEGAEFRFEPVGPEKPIVAYGTSICQGACASRPGMTWSNILQRRLGTEVVNLGFSGNAYLEKEVTDFISEIDAELYIIDAMPNTWLLDADKLRDTLYNAVTRIRAVRPDTPILLADHLGFPHGKAIKRMRDGEVHAWSVQKEVFDQLKADGVKGLFYLSHDEINLPQDATVEGIHVSDYGMVTYADAYEKKLRSILGIPKRKKSFLSKRASNY